jgi:2-C-methyl-D-erythritol 4-phosphate cytidylyltransferase
MIFAAILAGGQSARMDPGIPKQFRPIGGVPVLAHTLRAFASHKRVDFILAAVPESHMERARMMLAEYFANEEKRICLTAGGETRNETLLRVLRFARNTCALGDEELVLTHDAARPFVSHRIIDDNIRLALEYGACGTALPVTDTVFESADGSFVTKSLNRFVLYSHQTPQTFLANALYARLSATSPEERTRMTDACQIYTAQGLPVAIAAGERENIKITHAVDLDFAACIYEKKKTQR